MIGTRRDALASAPTLSDVGAYRRHVRIFFSRAFNSSLDTAFYDVGALTPRERNWLAAYTHPEGSVLIVHPASARQRIERFSPSRFVARQQRDAEPLVETVVVAGVGSSAMGTAALARNTADHLGRPVAGIVSGFGVADLWTEALGGWFVFGARNALRDTFARTLDALQFQDHVRDDQFHDEMRRLLASTRTDDDHFLYGSPDSATLFYILAKLGARIRLVLGHSKGSLSIENALEGVLDWCRSSGTPIPARLQVVTLGAVTHFPPEFPDVHQFLGRLDYFGMMNSRPLVGREWVEGAGHSLNTAVPGALSVSAALQAAGVAASG